MYSERCLKNGLSRREYGAGTYLDVSYPLAAYHGGRALCSDGVTRSLKRISETPDTFLSIPAAVTVRGRTVSGFVTFDTSGDHDLNTVILFIATSSGKNRDALTRS